MDSLMEKENCQIEGMMLQIAGGQRVEREGRETDDDCAPFCGCLGTGEIEFVQINR